MVRASRRDLVVAAVAALALVVAIAGCGSSATKSTASAPTAVRPPVPSASVQQALLLHIKTAHACLAKHGLHVSGGPVYPMQSPTSPDGELIVGSAKSGAFIAFYTNAGRATQLEPQLLRSVRRSSGHADRRGTVTVLLLGHPAPSLRLAVLTCSIASA